MKTLLLDLCDKIWEPKNKVNVRTKEEFQYIEFDNDLQEVEEMPEMKKWRGFQHR
jgi:hypothetical protein